MSNSLKFTPRGGRITISENIDRVEVRPVAQATAEVVPPPPEPAPPGETAVPGTSAAAAATPTPAFLDYTPREKVRYRLATTPGLRPTDIVAFKSVTVEDTGCGMTQEELGRLFTPFTQIESGAKQKGGGTGLGLFLSRLMADAQGGSLTAESEGPGRGARFTLRIPLRLYVPDQPVVQEAGFEEEGWPHSGDFDVGAARPEANASPVGISPQAHPHGPMPYTLPQRQTSSRSVQSGTALSSPLLVTASSVGGTDEGPPVEPVADVSRRAAAAWERDSDWEDAEVQSDTGGSHAASGRPPPLRLRASHLRFERCSPILQDDATSPGSARPLTAQARLTSPRQWLGRHADMARSPPASARPDLPAAFDSTALLSQSASSLSATSLPPVPVVAAAPAPALPPSAQKPLSVPAAAPTPAPPARAAPPPAPPTLPQPPQPKPLRMLVVDDVSANRLMLAKTLRRLFKGCAVDGAEDGEEALAAVKRAVEAGVPHDVVLMDGERFIPLYGSCAG